MIPRSGKFAIVALAALMALAGCAGKTTVKSDLSIKGAPDWVNEGTQYLADKKGRLFHGVGSAPDMNDEAMQIYTADQRARAELAQILSAYLDVVSKDYTAAAAAKLIAETDCTLASYSFLMELGFLNGRAVLAEAPIEALIAVTD